MTSSPPPPAQQQPRFVGDYVLGERLGTGAFATVWRARHRQTGAVVAVKEIDRRRFDSLRPAAARGGDDAILEEVAILRRVSHPNIVALLDAIQTKECLYLVLEYCDGGDLAAYLKRHGRVSESVARNFMQQLAAALMALRNSNLMHRDLKPQNILLSTKDKTAVLKIADFGFARYLTPQSLADTLCGSPLYMAPEIFQDRKYDAKADLWSIGAILFQLVTGKLPFEGNTQLQLFQNIMTSKELRFPPGVLADLNADCVDLCRGLLRRDPVQRLSFEDFFNHKFMISPRISGSCVLSTGGASEKSTPATDITAVASGNDIQSSACDFDRSPGSDSSDSIERGYVLVQNSTSMVMLSSFERSVDDYSTSYAVDCGHMANNTDLTAKDPALGAVSKAKHSWLSGSQKSTPEDGVHGSEHHTLTRIRCLNKFVSVLTAVAQEKFQAGYHLESLSIELVILALWNEALYRCNSLVDAFKGGIGEHMITEAPARLETSEPLAIYSWAKHGFVDACNRAEDVSALLRKANENTEMPDAMEILFQTALVAGKNGAVEELMGHSAKSVKSYTKAITLLTFILEGAAELPLTPRFSLSDFNQRRIKKYIANLQGHLNNSQMLAALQRPA